MHKCKTKDCNRIIEEPYIYCSIECACYDGVYSVTKGELTKGEEMEKSNWNKPSFGKKVVKKKSVKKKVVKSEKIESNKVEKTDTPLDMSEGEETIIPATPAYKVKIKVEEKIEEKPREDVVALAYDKVTEGYDPPKEEKIDKSIEEVKIETNKPAIKQLALNNQLIRTYVSIEEASQHTGIAKEHLVDACEGVDRFIFAGFKWMYI